MENQPTVTSAPPTLKPSAKAVATYITRQGGDGSAFLSQYESASQKDAAKADAVLSSHASRIREEIQANGTYYQYKDIVGSLSAGPAPTTVPPKLPPGVAAVATYMKRQGGDADDFTRQYQEAVKTGGARLQEVDDKVNGLVADMKEEIQANGTYYQHKDIISSLGAETPVAKTPVAAPAKSVRATGWLSEMAKSAYNVLADVPAGIARVPQVVNSALEGVADAAGLATSDRQRADVKKAGERFQQWGDSVGKFMEQYKFDLDNSGQYDKGLYDRDAEGNVDLHLFDGGAVHAIGTGLGTIASLFTPGLVAKAGKVVGVGTKALKAAQAAGDVERVAELVNQADRGQKVMRYAFSAASQIDPVYQEALKATGDPMMASRFTAAVVPVVAAMDAFTGVGRMAAGSSRILTRKAAAEAAQRLAAGEITEASFGEAAKTFAQKWIQGRAKAVGWEALEEGGTETLQEGYQIGVEELFDDRAGKNNFKNENARDRLGNAAGLGGLLGGGMKGAFYNSGAYHPTAFRALQSAYTGGGEAALVKQAQQLEQGRQSLIRSGQITPDQSVRLAGDLERMQSVVRSFDNPYLSVTPADQFRLYDLTYRQVPEESAKLDEMTQRSQGLAGDDPVDYQVGNDGRIVLDEDGQPQVRSVDPVVAGQIAEKLTGEIADQQRRVNYLTTIRDTLTKTGKSPADWAKAYDLIGTVAEGDAIQTPDGKQTTVTRISEDGQTLTTPEGEVKLIDARPSTQTTAARDNEEPVGLVPLKDKPLTQYQTGDSLYLNGDSGPERVTLVEIDQADGSLMVRDKRGQRRLLDLQDVLDSGDLLGGYDPERALVEQASVRQKTELRERLEQVAAKLGPDERQTLDSFRDDQLPAQINLLRASNNETAQDQAEYLQLRAEAQGVLPVTDAGITDSADASESDNPATRPDATAADTPTPEYVYALEVLTEEEIQGILDTGEVPQEIIDEVAVMVLADERLSEWQTRIYDNDYEAVAEAWYRLAEQLVNQPSQSNEQVQSTSDANGGRANSGPQTGDGRNDGEGVPGEGGGSLADPAGRDKSAVAAGAEPGGDDSPADGAAGDGGSQAVGATTAPAAGSGEDGGTATEAPVAVIEETAPATTPLAPEQNALTYVGQVGGVKINNNRGGISIATVVTVRDGQALVRYEVSNGADTKTTRTVEIWVKPEDNVLYAKGANVAVERALGVEGEGPLLGDIQVFEPGATAYVVVPQLGGDVRAVTVVTQQGNYLVVEGAVPGRTYLAYGDQATAEPPKGWVDPKEKFKNARKSWGTQSVPDGTTVRPIVQRMVERMQRAFPNVTVEVVGNDRMGADFGVNNDGHAPLGTYQDGVVYINADRATLTTPLHEFSHLWGDVLAKQYPNRLKRGMKLVAGSVYEQRVRQMYPDLTGDAILEEAVIQAIEDKGLSMLDGEGNLITTPTSTANRIAEWVRDTFRKLADATGWSWLSPDTTLDEWAGREAKDLLAEKVLSEQSSDDLAAAGTSVEVDGARQALYPAGPLPAVLTEADLRRYTFDRQQKKELFDPTLYANSVDAQQRWVRRRRDVADRQVFAQTQQQLADAKAEGGIIGITLNRILSRSLVQNVLDLRVLNKLTVGNSTQGVGSLLTEALTAARRRGAEVNVANHQIENTLLDAIKPYSTFRHLNRRSAVPLEAVNGLTSTGQAKSHEFTLSQLMSIALQYHSIMADHGGLVAQPIGGQSREGLTIWFRPPGESEKSDKVFLDASELQRIEAMFFGSRSRGSNTRQPTTWQPLLDALTRHFDQTFTHVDQTHLMTEGSRLKKSAWYFPIRVAKTKDGRLIAEQELLLRPIGQIVEDVSLLRDRQGRPGEVWAEDVLKVVERFNRNAQQYVLHQPVVQNLQHLSNNFGPDLIEAGNHNLKNALDNMARLLANPNERQAKNMDNRLYQLAATSLRLSTLARFAFNRAIPLKQFTGLTSALGNGELRDEYLFQVAWPALRKIGLAYALMGRGTKRGTYAVLGAGIRSSTGGLTR